MVYICILFQYGLILYKMCHIFLVGLECLYIWRCIQMLSRLIYSLFLRIDVENNIRISLENRNNDNLHGDTFVILRPMHRIRSENKDNWGRRHFLDLWDVSNYHSEYDFRAWSNHNENSNLSNRQISIFQIPIHEFQWIYYRIGKCVWCVHWSLRDRRGIDEYYSQ